MWTQLKAVITEIIKTNNDREITGQLLQNTLVSIVNSLGEKATLSGVAEPSTVPGLSDGPTCYLASAGGVYSNFNNIEIGNNEIAVLFWDGNSWTKQTMLYLEDYQDLVDLRDSAPLIGFDVVENADGSKTLRIKDWATKAFVQAYKLNVATTTSSGLMSADDKKVLAKKADAETVNAELKKKADAETVNAELKKKADAETVNAELKKKADAETVNAELKKKVNFDDNAAQLTSGFASNLVGRGDALGSTISFRATAGIDSITDGAANIKRLKGNTVAWNQIAETVNSVSSTNKNNIYRGFGYTKLSSVDTTHKYLALFNASGTSVDNQSLRVTIGTFVGSTGASFNQYIDKSLVSGEYHATFFTITDASYKYFGFYAKQPAEGSIILDDKNWAFYVQVHDLTLMFGVGNEPASLEDFYARIPAVISDTHVPHSLLGTNVTALKTVGFNAWDEQWEVGGLSNGQPLNTNSQIRSKNYTRCLPNVEYYGAVLNTIEDDTLHIAWYDKNKEHITNINCTNRIVTSPKNAAYFKIQTKYGGLYGSVYKNDICINLSHSGYRNGEYEAYKQYVRPIDISRIENIDGTQLFPYGLCSAGSVFDEITATKAIKRVGAVDLGTLMWTTLPTSTADDGLPNIRMSANLANIKPVEASAILGNLTCSKYVSLSADSVYLKNKGISVERVGYRALSLYDPDYTNPIEFKNAAQGVILFYELETPIEVTFKEPVNLDYEVSDFGTEEAIGENSAPISADIIYQFNAVDRIRTNSKIIKHKQDSLKHYSETDEAVYIKVVSKSDARQFSEIEISSSGVSVKSNSLNLRNVLRIIDAVFETLQIQGGINLAAKSLISSEINPGELKVLHRGSPEGFIIRTVENPDNPNDRLLLELLSTDGWDAYTYTFPAKSGRVALVSDIQSSSTTVDLTSNQTIKGIKRFDDNINLKGKSVISTSIDNGELKVLHNGSSKGFIVRTKNGSDNLLPLELLTTNGYSSYTYTFPAKGGTVALLADVQALQEQVAALTQQLAALTQQT